jgi:hypothetical protein
MDERIETFLTEMLNLEGQNSNVVREGVRGCLREWEGLFRDAEPDRVRKDEAVRRCRELCRDRVVEEIKRRKGTSTAKHLKLVLSVIDERAVKDE